MKCKDIKLKLNKWYEFDGELELCKSGFHFCPHMSGVWAYYPEDSKVFEVEAEYVLIDYQAGADLKYVAKRIRLIKEVKIGGDGNTGDRNTGNRNMGYGNTGNRNTGNGNTGDRNTGNRNTGDRNTGDGNTGSGNTGYGNTSNRNTGDGNTGYRNTGYRNTGNRNTGYRNTGNGNTGNGNTGDGNTGYRNTGYGNTGNENTGNRNTGYRNTGYGNTGNENTGNGNCCNYHTGLFCSKEPTVICFNKDTGMTRDEFFDKHPEYCDLSICLSKDEAFDYKLYTKIPNATVARIKALHKKHIEARII